MASCSKTLIFDMLAVVIGSLFQSRIVCGKKEYLRQSLLNEAVVDFMEHGESGHLPPVF